uniref:Uncharacterized protein n=1 Tax=Rhizophora mucronata TaxID=61149 RepID=A0A2P2Q5R7_RHIMU
MFLSGSIPRETSMITRIIIYHFQNSLPLF